MGTKRNPGAFDCYAKAKADEPMFTLLARDELASGLVLLWAALRGHKFDVAGKVFEEMAKMAVFIEPERQVKIDEASACAINMMAWSRARDKSAGWRRWLVFDQDDEG